jgi:uncharacterized membrane protein YdbT with pleckstrin-like domain
VSLKAKPKARLETVTTAKTVGTSKVEAAAVSQTLGQVANDVETPSGVSSRAAQLALEIQTAQTEAKREELMSQLAAFVAANI